MENKKAVFPPLLSRINLAKEEKPIHYYIHGKYWACVYPSLGHLSGKDVLLLAMPV
jgi:hypothetical protein